MNEVRKIRSKTGLFRIIEINAPIRFYWTEEGFDGIEVTFNAKLLTPHMKRLFDEVLDAVRSVIESQEDGASGDVPESVKKQFEEHL